jgi:lysophospholipase L1-like esterase
VVGNIPLPARWPTAYTTSPVWAASPDSATGHAATGGGDTTGNLRGPQGTEAGDGWVTSLNAALVTVVAEFAEATAGITSNAVAIADLATAANGMLHPELYAPEDVLHPNPAGAAAIAAAYYRALSLATTNAAAPAALGAA